MTFAYENIRLAELVAVTEQNKVMFDDFVSFLSTLGYQSLHNFIDEKDSNQAIDTLVAYFERKLPTGVQLLDGIARPYQQDKAKWLLVSWILRDAPEQRLRPMLKYIEGRTLNHRRAVLLNLIREHVSHFLSQPERWNWPTIAEVMSDRLEGSRRAIKGTLFEAIVRRILSELFEQYQLPLKVSEVEIRLEGETYDVAVDGPKERILIPVKTRETMGGGHALLFTRDIHKSISAARAAELECIPIVIAESWGGKLESLNAKHVIYVDRNPNQIKEVEPMLREQIAACMPIFVKLAA